MSLTNSLDLAGDWLAFAYRQGFNTIAFVRNDPDLASFRAGQPERYKALTTVKVSYEFVWGIFNDDIVVENNSPFELTNVRVEVFIRKGTRTWTPQIRCDSIMPGGSYKAVNVPGSEYDEASATVYSDQSASTAR